MTLSLVREEPDEVESLTSVSEAESGEAIPWLRLTIPRIRAGLSVCRAWAVDGEAR